MTDKCKSFFIIERLDMDKKSENLKKIYDLSILDKVYEVKPNDENKIQVNNIKGFNKKNTRKNY